MQIRNFNSMKRVYPLLFMIVILAGACHQRPPMYYCNCTSSLHPDSNFSGQIGATSVMTLADADTSCKYMHSQAATADTCTVAIIDDNVRCW